MQFILLKIFIELHASFVTGAVLVAGDKGANRQMHTCTLMELTVTRGEATTKLTGHTGTGW